MGISINLDGHFVHKEEYKFEYYNEFYKHIKGICNLWKPDVIITPYPCRLYRTLVSHSKYTGIVCLVADQREITLIEVADNRCKKVVLGKGNAKKEDVMAHFKEESEHIADSMLFTEWYLLSS